MFAAASGTSDRTFAGLQQDFERVIAISASIFVDRHRYFTIVLFYHLRVLDQHAEARLGMQKTDRPRQTSARTLIDEREPQAACRVELARDVISLEAKMM